jgi:S-disulfanyl-L-cysteine oxidoreductase SoxD
VRRQGWVGPALSLLAAATAGTSCVPTRAESPPASVGGSVVRQSQRLYGFGKPATRDEIAAWDIDVGPTGAGLPEGQGSVTAGAMVYQQKCAACHGATGIEGPFARLAGRLDGDAFPFANEPGVPLTIGNYWPYATTVFDYTRRSMPFDAPGSLNDDEVYAVVAYLLELNGIVERDAVMDAETLPRVRMPSRDRFVPDERRGGPEIR